MDNDLTEIEEALRTEDSPTQLASYLTKLAAILSYRNEQYKKVLLVKPAIWLQIQRQEPEAKPLSDKKTEMMWEATEDGQKEIALRMELKRCEILYRSINRRLRTLEVEYQQAKNL
jgi:hypothetical protein